MAMCQMAITPPKARAARVAETADDAANLAQMDKQEHRAPPRHKVYKGGKVSFHNESSVVDCIVRNVSEGGSRLGFPSHFACPRFVVIRTSGGGAYNYGVRQVARKVLGRQFPGGYPRT